MAIIKGIDITIHVNGQALQEYDDSFVDGDQDSKNQREWDGTPYLLTKYVEATSGARFAINAVVPKSAKTSADALKFALVLDGIPIDDNNQFMPMRLPDLEDGFWSLLIDGITTETKTGTIVRPYMFSDIKWSGDLVTLSYGKEDKSFADNVGTIVVKVWRQKVRRRVRVKRKLRRFKDPFSDAGEVEEKKLKGKNVTLRVCLGEEEQGRWGPWCYFPDDVDDLEHPFAIITFKYCSKRALQCLLLISRTPSPAPAPHSVLLEERPVDELTIEELRELARRQQARFQVERVKFEAGVKSQFGIKRERDEEVEELVLMSSAEKVKGPIANGEVVDISD